jgi:hypothetical protein
MAGETIRDVVIRIRLEQVGERLDPPDYSEAVRSAADYAESVETAGAAVIRSQEAVSRAMQSVERRQESTAQGARQSAESFAGFGEQAQSSSKQALEAFSKIGDGVFTLVRGLALLSDDGEEGLTRIAENVALAQGAFDTFKGVRDTVVGVVEGVSSLASVARATAGANAALAATNTTVAATGTAAAGAMGALQVAMGPIALAIGAVAAAGYLASKMWADHEAKLKEQALAAAQAANALALLKTEMRTTSGNILFAELRDLQQLYEKFGNRAGAGAARGLNIENVRRDLEVERREATRGRSTTMNTEAQIARFDAMAKAMAAESSRLSTETFHAATFSGKAKADQLRASIDKQLAEVEASRVKAVEQLASDREKEKASLERSVELSKQLFDLENSKVDAVRSAAEENRKSLEMKQKELESTQKLIDAERKRAQSTEERLGRLSGGDFARFQRLSQRLESGAKLNRDEMHFLESATPDIAGDRVGSEFAAIGRSRLAKSGDVTRPFNRSAGGEFGVGRLDELNRLNASVNALKFTDAESGLSEIAQRLEELRTQQKQDEDAIERVLRGLIQDRTQFERRVQAIENGLAQAQIVRG